MIIEYIGLASFLSLKSLIIRAVDISTLWPTLASWSHDHVKNHEKIYTGPFALWAFGPCTGWRWKNGAKIFHFCQKCSICKLFSPKPDSNCACPVRGNHCIIIFSMPGANEGLSWCRRFRRHHAACRYFRKCAFHSKIGYFPDVCESEWPRSAIYIIIPFKM